MMSVPGSNILNTALSVIAAQQITYYAFLSRSLNSLGQDVSVYASPFVILGSFQPVPRRLYEAYGLDLQKSYFMLYTSNNVLDITRNVSGDQVAFQGLRYQCQSDNEWFAEDGWSGILCVYIGPDIQYQTVFGFGAIPTENTNVNFYNSVFGG